MFPLRDDNPSLHASVITFLIIGANVLTWVFVQGLGLEPALTKSVYIFGLIPGDFLGTLPPGTEIRISRSLSWIVDGTRNWLAPVTSMFMHGGWFHIVGNMWFLAIFGDNVEDAMGPVRFTLFYLCCGLAAAAAQTISDPASAVPMVGASGAIGGVMGAYAVLYPRAPVHTIVFFGFWLTRIVVPAFLMLGYWFLLQVIGSFGALAGQGGVAFWAHVGGFTAGIVLLPLFRSRARLEERRKALQSWKGWRRRHY